MPSGFDYSKWDKLELSDDEDDHPGAKFIEENTLRRIKRESHERQEAERAAEHPFRPCDCEESDDDEAPALISTLILTLTP